MTKKSDVSRDILFIVVAILFFSYSTGIGLNKQSQHSSTSDLPTPLIIN